MLVRLIPPDLICCTGFGVLPQGALLRLEGDSMIKIIDCADEGHF